jgi:nucleoid DNA-binding protein
MDVAKYIGLFLLKNHFCYIHGLGNLELKRQPASYSGDALQAPSYDVHLSPSGSIDDNLANFIASNEQISISKASNALRDFSTQARADLAAGKDVAIPAIGHFTEEDGKIRFHADPSFKYTPPAMPATRITKRVEEKPKLAIASEQPERAETRSYVPVRTPGEEEEESGGLNWPRIILAAIVLLALVALITYAVKRYSGGEDSLQPVLPTKENVQQTVPAADTTAPGIDTSANAPAVNQNTSVQNGVMKFKVIIESFGTKAPAEKKLKTMRGWGHPVELITEDSNKHFLVLPLESAIADTAKLLDSIKTKYGLVNITIY